MSTTTRSLRIPTDLDKEVTAAAEADGLTFTEYVTFALRRHLGWDDPAYPDLARAVRDRLDELAADGFDIDITRTVFLSIRDTPTLRRLYAAAVAQNTDKFVNQRIGRLVKTHLGAEVIGTSKPLPEDELIVTHSLLVPAG
ncbi:hypothetical protein DVS28_b0485 (plasmid) [Euzebya pacifica]|uniref:Uncharacterized protein n=1 Tax=Euzebya pacifica TaxID=1608957 RepID=A0A346Y6X8_9ACTN|nr:hypothetical protein [Euzebya pacifica]AXV10225.1 hypothetical protein DVS28_b0485 [Euzebya pacifica]